MEKIRKLTIIIRLFVVVLAGSFVTVECTNLVTVTEALTSCTNQPPLYPPELPNLSHAKVYQQVTVPTATCIQTDIISVNLTYTWYYHSTYPPPHCHENDCCFNTTTSLVAYTTLLRSTTASNTVLTRIGSVIHGAYSGSYVESVLLLPLSDQTACLTGPGREIYSGLDTLTITGGPTCEGVEISEIWPGMKLGF